MKDMLLAMNWVDILTQVVIWAATAVILPKVWQYVKLSADDKTRGYLETALRGAIRAGINSYAKSQNKSPVAVILSVVNDHEVRLNITQFASDYLKHNTPAALRRLKINGGLADIIIARLDDIAEEMSKSFSNTAQSLDMVQRATMPVEQVAATSGAMGAPLSPVGEQGQQASLL